MQSNRSEYKRRDCGADIMSDTNTCGRCEYFGKEMVTVDDETYLEKGTGYHICDRIKHNVDDLHANKSGMKAAVMDGSGYYAALIVESDFGCIAWAKRPKANG